MYLMYDRKVKSVLVAAALLGMAACSDEAGELPTEVGAELSPSLQPAEAPANHRLAQLVALALRDPAVRGMLNQDMKASPVKEGKLFLSTYLRGKGAALLNAMTRATGVAEAEIFSLLEQTGPMEIYLPVDAHRAQWNGGSDVLVATQMEEGTVPFGVDPDYGQPLMLSLDGPPAVPTISIVPAEGFDVHGQPNKRDLQASVSTSRQSGGLNFSHSTTGTMYTGLWVNEVHTTEDHEDWARGDAEFEIHVENAAVRGSGPSLVCAEAGSIEPYRWDLNGVDYAKPFLIARENEVPEGVQFVVALWEDDDTTCEIVQGKDYVKLTVDAFTNLYSADKLLKEKKYEDGQFLVKVYNGLVAAREAIETDDDFVGVSSVVGDIGSSPQESFLKDTNMNNKGRIILQWKTDTAH